jgi:hypothetical protein
MATEKQLAALEKVREIKWRKLEEQKIACEKNDIANGLPIGTSLKAVFKEQRAKSPEGHRQIWLQGLLVSMQIIGARNPGNLAPCIAMADAVLNSYKKRFPK